MSKSLRIQDRPGRQTRYANAPDDVMELIKLSASFDDAIAMPASRALAYEAFQLPLRQGIMAGNVAEGIFIPWDMPPGTAPEFPIDIIQPGTEKNYNAFVIPYHGYIPQRPVEGDFLMVPTFEIGNAIDWPLRLIRDGRWDITGRAAEVFEAGFVKKYNDDAFHTLIMAGQDRAIIVNDPNAAQGRFTLGLLTRMSQVMRRKAGGNTTSRKRGRLSDVFISIEGFQDMRSWTLSDVDEQTRREIFTSNDGGLSQIYDIVLHDLFELGVGQEYQTFYTSTLGGSLASGDQELLIGLDLSNPDSFVNPIRALLEVFPDTQMHRSRKGGIYGWQEHGFMVADSRRVLFGSC